MYVMLAARHPFRGVDADDVFDAIVHSRYTWPSSLVLLPETKDLVAKLLHADEEKRLGYNGAAEVKAHPFFTNIRWEHLFDAPSPYFVPQLDDEEDTGYFPELSNELPVEEGEAADKAGLEPDATAES